MNMRRYVSSLVLVVGVAGLSATVAFGEGEPVPAVSRVEVVLADQYRNQVPVLKEDFAQAGMTNVHFQFARRGQPPQNIGLGRDLSADKAREAIRLAVKYNGDVRILLPERLFPPRFVTIASSNYDDTVEYHINQQDLANLQNPSLNTEEFHRLYRSLTSTTLKPKGRY